MLYFCAIVLTYEYVICIADSSHLGDDRWIFFRLKNMERQTSTVNLLVIIGGHLGFQAMAMVIQLRNHDR